MGEYYDWVNVDKREYLSPSDFGFGSKLHESMQRKSEFLSALYLLLATDWKVNRVIFLGDEGDMPFPQDLEIFRILNNQVQQHQEKSHYYDMIIETYWNVSALFKASEVELRPEFESCIEWINYGEQDYNC